MRHTVQDEKDLPTVAGMAYVRCASAPEVVSHPKTGDAYVRADGAPWPHAGYRVDASGVRAVGPKDGFSDPGELVAKAYWDAVSKEAK